MTTITPQEFAAGLRVLVQSGELERRLLREFTLLALEGEGDAKRNATTNPRVRTDRLRASISGTARVKDNNIELVLAAGGIGARGEVAYAKMQEFGGVQVPKRAKMLRIPLGPAKTAAGVDRFSTPLRSTGAGEFYVWKSEDGRLFLRKTDTGELWYRLVYSSRIPATRFLGRAVDKLKPQIPDLVRDVVTGALPGAQGAPA